MQQVPAASSLLAWWLSALFDDGSRVTLTFLTQVDPALDCVVSEAVCGSSASVAPLPQAAALRLPPVAPDPALLVSHTEPPTMDPLHGLGLFLVVVLLMQLLRLVCGQDAASPETEYRDWQKPPVAGSP